jgi:putative membrane protein insertion efficiency factor|uniref:membrane protein insertion efficiency factor YidD n=1 Tax=Candidatus Nanopelagicus sp. TaxID=2518620 RepID=UPI004049BC25
MRFVLTLPIKAYQKYISPLFAPRCKYYPSCSTYTELAITEFGIKGLFMGIYRFVRCNPFSHGGVDYPSKQAVLVVRERQMS